MTAIDAPLPAARLGVGELVTHSLLLARRNLMRFRSNPAEVIGAVAFPLIFVVLFVFVFGGAIAGSTHAYLQFALPGVLAQSVVFGSQLTGTSLNTDIQTGIFDRFRSLPIARSAPLVGQICADVLRVSLGIVITIAFGLALGFRPQTGLPQILTAFALMIAFAFALSWIATLIGLAAKNAATVQAFEMLLMFPLTFASSVFVPARTMPGALRWWAEVSPVSVLSDTVRALMLGGSPVRPGLQTLCWAARMRSRASDRCSGGTA